MSASRFLLALFVTVAWICESNAFYVPGWSIKSYREGDKVPLYVNKVSSDATQLPFAYYDLPFVCEGGASAKSINLNLGEVLRGDRISGSDFDLNMKTQVECATLCEKKVNEKALGFAEQLIKQDHHVEWIVDNLPGATVFVSTDRTKRYYASGFALGVIDEKTKQAHINNHFSFVLRYRPDSKDVNRFLIVGFEVYPSSVSYDSKKCSGKKDKPKPQVIDPTKKEDTIRYTYSVIWREETSVEWSNRWDLYLERNESSEGVHWVAAVNSLVIDTVLAIIVMVVLVRTLNRDIAAYKKRDTEKLSDDIDDGVSGWKLLNADVFRPPTQATLLSSLVASGSQLFVVAMTVTVLSCIGILNPSYRGGLLSYALFSFAFAGIFAGYVNARLNKYQGNEDRIFRGVGLTAMLVPAVMLLITLSLNLFVWWSSSSSAIPIGTIIALFSMWLLISCPLVVIGAVIGNKVRKNSKAFNTVSQIPRQIPPQSFANGLILSSLLSGMTPFAVIFVELVFVFKSLWQEAAGYYYFYGFFGLTFLLLLVTVMEMSILSTYLLLNKEDYRWWWKSFMAGAGSAWWIFFYSIYYYFTALNFSGVSAILFFGYSLMGCLIYGLITGSVGFLASYLFVRRIYYAIKKD